MKLLLMWLCSGKSKMNPYFDLAIKMSVWQRKVSIDMLCKLSNVFIAVWMIQTGGPVGVVSI